MPRIDPEKLLKCIGVLLSPNGGIRSSAEVKRLSGLMEKYCKKLVSKCIYIQILKCTDTELLGQFMEAGGWKLAHGWLKEGIETKNWPLVQELLELLLLCPVDVPRLQSNDAPRLVKGLSREGSGNDGVRILAAKLVEQWLKIAKGETMTIASQNLIIVNKDYVQSQHNQIILNKGIMYSDSNKDAIDESASLDGAMHMNGIIDRDENDSDKDVVNENNCNEGLVYKFTVKDGKKILSKVSDASSPKKLNNQISRSSDGAVDFDSDEPNLLKVRNSNSAPSTDKSKSKDDKDATGKQSSDRSKSKDRSRDKDRKSSSSSSHKTSSGSSKSSSSSSSKHGNSSSSTNHGSSSSSSKTHKSSNGSSKTGSSSSSSSSRDKSKDKHRSSSTSTSKSSSSSSRDKEKRDDKDSKSRSESSKQSQADKDKATLAKVLPQAITKIGKIPKKQPTADDKGSSETATEDDKKATAPKKKSISIEVRKDADRPKTVKTYNSQFRSHGLAEEAPPPPSRRDLKKPSSTPTPSITIPSSSSAPGKRSLSPISSATKDNEKKMKISSPTSEKPGAIKLIPAKPKPSVLVESDMFMDAISAATNKKEVRKRKRSKESESNTKDTNSKAAAPAGPMKFYQDTLDDSDAKEDKVKDETVKQENETDDVKIKTKRSKSEDGSADESVQIKEESDTKAELTLEEEVLEYVKREPGVGCGPDGPPGVLTLHRRKGPKKSLRWRPQEALEEIRYFELDENERVNVTKTFGDAKQMEHVSEREAFLIARKSGSDDVMAEQIPWAPLIEVDDVPAPSPVTSKEKDIQTERERTCLKTIYFNRSMIPDSPSEPDVIAYPNVEPKIMPLFDITGNPDAVHDFTNMPWPEPKGSPVHSAGNLDDMNGFGNFGQFGQTQFGNMNWPLGQQPNSMLNMRPPQAIAPFGAMIPPDAMNQMPFQRPMNPAMPTNFGPNGPPPGFINNFAAPMQAMGRGGVNGPPNQNWFGNNMNGTNNNNWQTQQPMAANNPNNNRLGWMQGRRLCKQFQRGYCRHGDTCKFMHPGVNCPPF